jgi:hypothetical protein
MKAWKVVKIVALVIVIAVVAGFVVMHLWNWLMPAVFGLKTITFLQAIGLLLLSKILLGGFHKHGHGGRREWKRHMEDRWGKMSTEERERFRAGMRGRRGWNCGPRPEAGGEARGGERSI